jgi:hypothetical protein
MAILFRILYFHFILSFIFSISMMNCAVFRDVGGDAMSDFPNCGYVLPSLGCGIICLIASVTCTPDCRWDESCSLRIPTPDFGTGV